MSGIPTTRDAVRAVWDNSALEYSGVTDTATAGLVLTGLLDAALNVLQYRKLAWEPDAIQLVSSDPASYLRYQAANDHVADVALLLSQALSAHAANGLALHDITGEIPPWKSMRVLILATGVDATFNRLDLDPEGECKVSWHGRFDTVQFTEIAAGFAAFVTHIVANVFHDDDGKETFEESFDWVV